MESLRRVVVVVVAVMVYHPWGGCLGQLVLTATVIVVCGAHNPTH
jgi:hypothetical protein